MKHLVLISVLLLVTVQPGLARVLGTVGRTYPIIERDALEEVQERAAQINWRSKLDRIKPEKFRPQGLPWLPRAVKDRSFLVDMTYTLGFDIPDGKGGILYPKGYRFNPLDYLPFNQTLVVFNGEDPLQVSWLKTSGLLSKSDTVLLLSGGSFVDVGKRLNHLVYYATPQIVARFHLQVTPSIIRCQDKLMEVEEVKVEREK